MIRSLRSDNFPPFGKVHVDFPPVDDKPDDLGEVHLFTGVNGTGKTRLLAVLAAFLGGYDALQKRLVNSSVTRIAISQAWPPAKLDDGWLTINGSRNGINYSAGQPSEDIVPLSEAAFAYSGAAYVVDAKIEGIADLAQLERRTCLAFSRLEADSKELLKAIFNLKIQSAVDEADAESNRFLRSRARLLANSIESAITEITGRKFQFHASSYPKVQLEVRWAGIAASLPFAVLPDGLRSIIGWLAHAVVMMDVWLKGKSDPNQVEAIFLLDEIETHLHPAWQRHVLPAFQRIFPKSQIFVTTHSPFVIASLNHGWIHPLTMDPAGQVRFENSIPASRGDSYLSVLEEIMGIKEWYDPETEGLLKKFREARDANEVIQARELAREISSRSMELDFMMGRELRQLDLRNARREA